MPMSCQPATILLIAEHSIYMQIPYYNTIYL